LAAEITAAASTIHGLALSCVASQRLAIEIRSSPVIQATISVAF
jgi:hypothetical protein